MAGTYRILVVDDEAAVRRLLEATLSRAGHTITSAESSEAALVLLENQSFDLMVTDKNLPGQDGLELARQCSLKFPRMPVVMISGYTTWEARVGASDVGIMEWITKPFDLKHVVEVCEATASRNKPA